MNPKEVSYSHPQLPLCDTPISFGLFQPLAGIGTQKYRFFQNMQEAGLKKLFIFLATTIFYRHLRHLSQLTTS